MNYCGIRTDFIDFLVDRNPYKHGRFTPGTHIPIHPVERLDAARPDYVLILPWNLTREITRRCGMSASGAAASWCRSPRLRVVEPVEVLA